MKTIIISIRPEWARHILNGDKTIEIRRGLSLYNALKKAEEKGEDVEFLMYVTKDKNHLLKECSNDRLGRWFAAIAPNHKDSIPGLVETGEPLNGKIVAWFKPKAEVIFVEGFGITYRTKNTAPSNLWFESCLSHEHIDAYLQRKPGTALHIRSLGTFNEPKTLADYGLKRAPVSWCYAKEAR